MSSNAAPFADDEPETNFKRMAGSPTYAPRSRHWAAQPPGGAYGAVQIVLNAPPPTLMSIRGPNPLDFV